MADKEKSKRKHSKNSENKIAAGAREEKNAETPELIEYPAKVDHKPNDEGQTRQETKEVDIVPEAWKKLLLDMDGKKFLELSEAFHLFDFDRDGTVSVEDLKRIVVAADAKDITDEDIIKMVAEGSNPLDINAFITLMAYKTLDLGDEEVLINAFSKWDYGSGLISEEVIKHDLTTWGDKFTEEEVKAVLECAPIVLSKNKERMIDYIQFCNELCGIQRAQSFCKLNSA